MIVYNMRYRGAIEYDKMVLNILNFYNEVHAICVDEYQVSEYEQTVGSYLKKCNQHLNEFEKSDGVAMTFFKKEMENFIPLEQGIGESY